MSEADSRSTDSTQNRGLGTVAKYTLEAALNRRISDRRLDISQTGDPAAHLAEINALERFVNNLGPAPLDDDDVAAALDALSDEDRYFLDQELARLKTDLNRQNDDNLFPEDDMEDNTPTRKMVYQVASELMRHSYWRNGGFSTYE